MEPTKIKNAILIGFVKCKHCHRVWEALCMENEVGILVCPVCASQGSEVVKPGEPTTRTIKHLVTYIDIS